MLVTPVSQAFQQVLHWTAMLSRSVDPSEIHNAILTSVPQWEDVPELQAPRARISSLLPPKPDTIPPFSTPVTRELLVQVLDGMVGDLEGATNDAQLLGNIDYLRRRYARLKQESGNPIPVAPAVFYANGTREIPTEVIERQMGEALRDALAKVTHDANNILGALMGEMGLAEEGYRRVDELARAHFHLIPADVKERLDGYLESMDGVLAGMGELLVKTAQLVRGVQRVIHSSNDANGPSVFELPRLMSDGGLIAQITIVLFDLLTDVRKGEENLKAMNLIADQFGHVASENDLAEGLSLLRELSEYFQTAGELTTLTVDLFRLHQEFISGLRNGGEGSVDLHAYLNRRILGAFMGRKIEVSLSLDDAPWRIPGPSIRVWQVILNNIVNARDALGWGGRLSVSTRRTVLDEDDAAALSAPLIRGKPSSGEFMVLEIRDNGPGIPPHVLPRIFEPSFSGKQSSGLGLAVTLQILQNMGGFITVRTSTGSENHGTAFSIYFPRVKERAASVVRPASEIGREVLLVVDGDEEALQTTRRELMDLGYAVLTAPGVEEAVARSRDWYQDLTRPSISAVLLDLKSAGAEAHPLLEKLRAVDPYMVCLFQNGMGYLHEELQGVEMSGFVAKSSPIEETVGQMRFLLNRMRRHRPTIPVPLRPQPKADGR